MALMVATNVPVVSGLPEINPVALSTIKPAGRPVALNLVGALLALISYRNSLPLVPVTLEELEITGAGGVITTSDSAAEPVPPALLALIVTANVPLTAGLPEINPVTAFTLRPLGSFFALKLRGLFLAVIW
jgi:hypothetical protein